MMYDEISTHDFCDDPEQWGLSAKDLEIFLDCASCNKETAHTKLVCAATKYSDEEAEYSREELYFVVECLGCKTISFFYLLDENDSKSSELYPSRIAGQKELNDAHLLPQGVYQIYRETHSAINNTLNIIAGIGIRAIIESICKDKNIDGKNLKERITKMKELGVTTPSGEVILHSLRFLGNKSAHEVKAHSTKELQTALEVIDHLLLGVYILPIKSSILNENTKYQT